MERSLRVLDGAVAVFDGKEGVEPQSEQVWRQADKYDVPRICFVNKMDKIGADFYFSVKTMEDRLGANVIPIQLPVGSEGDFEGVVDLVEMKAKVWRGETKLGETYDTIDIPAELAEKADEYRTKLLEAVAETDEALLEKYFGGEELTVDEIKGAHPQADHQLARPTWCCAAARSRTRACSRCSTRSSTTCPRRWTCRRPSATPPARRTWRSSASRRPTSRSPRWRSRSPRTRSSASSTYVRVYSGKVDSGSQVINATKGKKERLGKLFQMHSNKENPVETARRATSTR